MKTLSIFFLLFTIPFFLSAQPKEVIDAYNLQNAIRNFDTAEVTKLISGGTDVNVQYNGRNALHVACESNSKDLALIIIDAGGDVNAKRDEGEGITTLQNAVRSFTCTSDVIKILLEKGADPNAVGPNGKLAINLAISKSGDKEESLKILTMLIEFKANVNPDTNDDPPVIQSIIHSRPDMLPVLLQHGADPNAAGKKSKYPLHIAVENRDIESVKTLKSNGAKTDVKNGEGQTPLEYASMMAAKPNLDSNSKKKYQEIVEILSK